MPTYEFDGRRPTIGAGAYVHPSAEIIGDVVIGERCWIGPGARLRGDYGSIVIEQETSVEDNCVVHARPGECTRIGRRVTLGHACVIHNAAIRDYAIVGMGAVVSDWAIVGEWAVIGEGAVVRQKQVVPDGRIAVGVPAKVLDKAVDEEYRSQWLRFKELYVDLARRYPGALKGV